MKMHSRELPPTLGGGTPALWEMYVIMYMQRKRMWLYKRLDKHCSWGERGDVGGTDLFTLYLGTLCPVAEGLNRISLKYKYVHVVVSVLVYIKVAFLAYP